MSARGRHRRGRAVGRRREDADDRAQLRQAVARQVFRLLRAHARRRARLRWTRHACAGDVQRRDRQRVGDHVVDLAGDPLPFVVRGAVGEIGLRSPELAERAEQCPHHERARPRERRTRESSWPSPRSAPRRRPTIMTAVDAASTTSPSAVPLRISAWMMSSRSKHGAKSAVVGCHTSTSTTSMSGVDHTDLRNPREPGDASGEQLIDDDRKRAEHQQAEVARRVGLVPALHHDPEPDRDEHDPRDAEPPRSAPGLGRPRGSRVARLRASTRGGIRPESITDPPAGGCEAARRPMRRPEPIRTVEP